MLIIEQVSQKMDHSMPLPSDYSMYDTNIKYSQPLQILIEEANTTN
jgi:hypothetical protein